MTARSHGVDVSHHQSPDSVPWKHVAMESSFAYVRATYGTAKDRATAKHVERARGVGMRVGLYHFFRMVQNITDQLRALKEQAEACAYGVGDLAPVLDIEDDPKVADVAPAWSESAAQVASAIRAHFGECVVYITQRDWGRLGRPRWVLDRPLWVAHWTSAEKPATPGGRPWALWQYRVGPYVAGGPGGVHAPQALDHNWATEPLPVCSAAGPPGAQLAYEPVPTRFDGDDPDVLRSRVEAQQFDLLELAREEMGRNDGDDAA